MEFRILGPLEVLDQRERLPLPRLKERTVLAVLLLHANEFVSRERLIDELWGDQPPPTASKAVNVYVSQLRKTLARNGADPIATADGGYRLVVGPDLLDAERMRSLVAKAREQMADGESEAASRLLQEALSLWRGPTLAGLVLESLGREEVAQLDELRLAALMDRIDCDLALGRHEQVLGELNVLVREHPLRERLRAQQMLALYRADRQAEALDAYAQARRTLVDDLGIEPSPALQRLQQAILRHDPSLETPTGTAAVNGLAPPPPVPPSATRPDAGEPGSRRRRRPRRWQLAIVALVIVAASAAAAILSTEAGGAPHVVPNSLVRLDPRTGKVVSVTPVGVEPGSIAVTRTAIWTVNHGDRTISRYDLHSHSVQSRGGFPHQAFDIVVDADGNVWVSSKTPIVTRLAAGVGGTSAGPLYPSKTETIGVPGPGVGYEALGAGYVWATVGPLTIPGEDDRLSLIDLASNRVVASMRLGRAVTAIAFGDGAAWVGTFIKEPKDQPPPWKGPSWLYVIRAGARQAQSYRLETGDSTGPLAIAVGEGHVWVLMCGTCNVLGGNQRLLEIDPDTRQVIKRIPMSGLHPAFLAVGAGSVWVASPLGPFAPRTWVASVAQIDPHTNKIVRTIPLGGRTEDLCGIAATRDTVWVAIGDTGCDTIGR